MTLRSHRTFTEHSHNDGIHDSAFVSGGHIRLTLGKPYASVYPSRRKKWGIFLNHRSATGP